MVMLVRMNIGMKSGYLGTYLHLRLSITSLTIVFDYNIKPQAIPPYPRLRTH
jgi:hypothetical protein